MKTMLNEGNQIHNFTGTVSVRISVIPSYYGSVLGPWTSIRSMQTRKTVAISYKTRKVAFWQCTVPLPCKKRKSSDQEVKGLPDRLEEEACLLDIVDVSAMRGNHGLQVCEVALRVHHCLP